MLKIWTHTSVAWWPETPFARADAVGGNTLMVFAKSPRGWKIPAYTDEQFEEANKQRNQSHQIAWMVHSNYLANLSKPEEQLTVEIESIVDDFTYAHRLGYESVNVHVGKLKDRKDRDEAMTNMAKNVEKILKAVRDSWYDDVQYLFENTAGQWSEIGSTMEELSYFYQNYLKDLPVKFTIDTAHCRGGGVDITKRDEFLEEFATTIWLEQLHSIHLNDAKVPLWAKLDRHASLWRGFVGWKTLTPIIQRAFTNERPMYIETVEPELRPDEVAKVKQIAAGDLERIDAFHAEHYKTQYLKKFEDLALQKWWSLFG